MGKVILVDVMNIAYLNEGYSQELLVACLTELDSHFMYHCLVCICKKDINTLLTNTVILVQK